MAVAQFARAFCTNIYNEMESIFSRGVDPGVDQDLVMEQVRTALTVQIEKYSSL